MDRRTFVRLLAIGGAACGVMGHSPYRQWQVYRKSRLIIVMSGADPASYALGETVATLLARHWPESRALPARAADTLEIVKLLESNQLDLAILTADDARDVSEGRGRFAARGVFRLRTIATLGAHVLVGREDVPDATAHAIARTLQEHWRPPEAFPDVARRVVDAFSTETKGVRNVRIDLRRRDMTPEADVTLVGVLGMDIMPKDGAAWYSIRLLFGQREGRWSFLKAYHELPGQGPVWTEVSGWYRTVAEHAVGP